MKEKKRKTNIHRQHSVRHELRCVQHEVAYGPDLVTPQTSTEVELDNLA